MTIDRTKIVQSREPARPWKRSNKRLFCAICRYNYADMHQDDNLYHAECLESLKREYHVPPIRLQKEGPKA